jgi:predicted CXXCH cytochrome family protein
MSRWIAAAALGWLVVVAPASAQTNVATTKHNLTASGPGTFRTTEAAGLCVFCHTPHNASPTRGLWNRELPAVTYQLYASSTTKAQINQPTGSSRLCLSCHDGLLAVGNLRSAPKVANTLLGALTGASALGTNLSGEHPVSFVYDNSLALARGQLASPSTLPPPVRLDDTMQMQCTSCHDPHEDRHPNFLRADNRGGGLCTACHRPTHWGTGSHATSPATWTGTGPNPWPAGAFPTVADNGCTNCHRSHAAGHGQRLLAQSDEAGNCTVCHNGAVAAKNVEGELLKPYRHDVGASQWVHDTAEDPLTMPRHVACSDCHNGHAATAAAGLPPLVPGALVGVKGVNLQGVGVPEASFEYEVCSNCHGVSEPSTPGIARKSGTRNVRLKILSTNASFHPIAATGRNASIPGLQAGYTASSLVSCTSCHNNDDWTSTSANAPRGPHGSRNETILAQAYMTGDPTPESYANYALCYQCHNQSYVANDLAATFPHNRHLVQDQAPCASCHDAHGSRDNAHLIDFMLRDRTGKIVVTPSAVQGRLEYASLGQGHGQCYLQCHGVNHEPKSY